MMPQADMHMHIQSFVLTLRSGGAAGSPSRHLPAENFFNLTSDDGLLEVSARSRWESPGETAAVKNTPRLLLTTGDAAVLSAGDRRSAETECSGAAAQVQIDFREKTVQVVASLVGLPPVFYLEQGGHLIITSDIYLLKEVAGCSLRFSSASIHELSVIGYPVGGKTLFKDIHMLPAGHTLTASGQDPVSITRHWQLPQNTSSPTWSQFLEKQASAFTRAMTGIDVASSFLSLTAGMDTRAILSALMAEGRTMPAYTMSGPNLSLDARTAGNLCRAYGLDHATVFLDSHFHRQLPRLTTAACRLSGGIASLSQAHEVFFYSKVDPRYRARLSGNLGNQVGRGGAENISLRQAGFMSFSEVVRHSLEEAELSHWYVPYLRSGGNLSFAFLLEQEIPYSSVGNYCLNNSFAAQQTPYADRRLIETSASRPPAGEDGGKKSLLAMRIKDLHHRFLGDSVKTSFQKKFIRDHGGPAAEIPINWGSRAKGGISPAGVFRGIAALADVAVASKSGDNSALRRLATMTKIAGVHEYRPYNRWLRTSLQEFARDVFRAQKTAESGIFDIQQLEQHADRFFAGEASLFKHISLALDLALAADVFDASL